jgi:4-diphosphocytidyl-2-C-methyl-D-erythritol kinase
MVCVLSSPAKLNLFLNVTGQRSDGFHNLVSVFFRLAGLADTLLVSTHNKNAGLTLTCTDPTLAHADNVVAKAYTAFYAWFPQLTPVPLTVHLVKTIPMQAGLGGGSSNAAALLQYLYQRHQAPCHLDRLMVLASAVGSDVPFFLSPYAMALVQGKGETLQPVDVHPDNPVLTQPWLIIQPNAGMPTPAAYHLLRTANRYKTEPLTPILNTLATNANPSPWFLNDFEPVTEPAIPALAQARQLFLALGVLRPILCGSGSAMAGLLPGHIQVSDVQNQLTIPDGWRWWWVPPATG